MHAAEGAVVDHTLQPWGVGGDAGDGVHGGGGFAAGGGDPVGVEDDPPVDVGAAHGNEDEFESPCCLAGAFEVQRTCARCGSVLVVQRPRGYGIYYTCSSTVCEACNLISELPRGGRVPTSTGWYESGASAAVARRMCPSCM
jgi:hypothetical protein